MFLRGCSTYNPHLNDSGQDSVTKTLFELHFQSKLEALSNKTGIQFSENPQWISWNDLSFKCLEMATKLVFNAF